MEFRISTSTARTSHSASGSTPSLIGVAPFFSARHGRATLRPRGLLSDYYHYSVETKGFSAVQRLLGEHRHGRSRQVFVYHVRAIPSRRSHGPYRTASQLPRGWPPYHSDAADTTLLRWEDGSSSALHAEQIDAGTVSFHTCAEGWQEQGWFHRMAARAS